MTLEQQIPRNALAWIIISLFTLVAPHIERIPVWVLLVYVLASAWRIQVFRGRWSFPGRWIKFSLIISCFVGIYLSFGSLIGLEPTVALLLSAFALKLIELVHRKDAYVLIFLGYFVCLTEFLFSQDILLVLYSLMNVLLVTTALIALHHPGEQRFNWKSFRLGSIMLMQAFPMMVVLFFLFPRIGPLWTVPIKSHSAKTGMSDFMRPGDVSNLSQSSAVAFRAQFDGDIPPSSQLYWRGLVMSRLNDGAWSSLGYYDVPAPERRLRRPEQTGEPQEYSVILEPTQQNWLFALRYSQSLTSGVMEAPDFRLFSPVIVENDHVYRARLWRDTELEPELSEWRRDTELKLPVGENPRTVALAQRLRSEAGSDREFAQTVMRRFSQAPYSYTLQPPLLGENPMDAFLFETRSGFCEHYAYAFAVMMRAGGVPARVIGGYLGGEVNPVNQTVIVHQFDAHAWTEIWLEGEGWVRFDPTSAVAPDRIEWGLERAVAGEGTFLSSSPLSPLRYRNIDFINAVRLRYEALTYRWQSWVVNFNSDQQYQILQDFFGDISARKFIVALMGTWALVLIPVALSLLLKRRTHSLKPWDKLYLRFCARLARQGIVRDAGEAPGDFAERVKRQRPSVANEVDTITGLYIALAYQADSDNSTDKAKELQRTLSRSVRRFQLQPLR
ncbi:MAG: DUF3488 and transglutaminase-like domain-containing protein [Halioglobus sp.]